MRRPDESMSLLTDLQRNALEPEYREVAAQNRPASPAVFAFAVALLAILLVVAVVSTTRTQTERASERDGLMQHIADQKTRLDGMEAQLRSLEAEVRDLGDRQVTEPALRTQLDLLESASGAIPVTGPGVVVVVNDSPSHSKTEGLVFDSDLSRLVNGLRQAGAEAVAINGRRVTALTPIRTAGAAITVDYVSLSPPYRVEAIGDPATIQARFARTSAASWWNFIQSNYGIGFEMRAATGDLSLPADPGMTLRFASS